MSEGAGDRTLVPAGSRSLVPPDQPTGPWQTVQMADNRLQMARSFQGPEEVDLEANKISTVVADGAEHSSLQRCEMPISVKFKDVQYEVVIQVQKAWWQSGRGQKKEKSKILHGITGAVLPGELLAMMGPSGSGKTTLLNILGGRLRQGVSGDITYNDHPYDKSLKRQSGFVTQDDVLYANLTVYETLLYAAMLRLPKALTRKEKRERALAVMQELGLDKCRDTIIGGPFMRGVSGGERKRVSIGHEMLINPSLLYLDEPTSGLDSTTALRILSLLNKLAEGGRTIITTIHQPSSKMFLMFDKLLLLADGHTMYYGQASQAMQYFKSVGYVPKYATNPADYLLDLATGEVADGPEKAKAVKDELVQAYQVHRAAAEQERIKGLPMALPESKSTVKSRGAWPTSWIEQFQILLVRGLKERRFEALGGLRLAQIVAVSLVAGALWWQSGHGTEADISDQSGLLFFESTFWGFFPLFTALFTFPTERQMLNKERASGMYRLSAYFFARTAGDLPLELVMPTVFSLIVYWMAGLTRTFVAYILHLLVLLLSVLVAQSLGLAIGAAVMQLKRATTLASVIMLTFLLAGGYFVRGIPVWIKWIKYLSFPFYTFQLLLKVQYGSLSGGGEYFSCPGVTPNGLCLIENSAGVHGISLSGGGLEAMALILMLIGYRFLAYLALQFLNKGTK